MSHCVRKFYELNFRAYYCGKVQLPKLLRPRQYARIREKAAVTRLMLGNQKPGGFYEVWTTLVFAPSGLGFFLSKVGPIFQAFTNIRRYHRTSF